MLYIVQASNEALGRCFERLFETERHGNEEADFLQYRAAHVSDKQRHASTTSSPPAILARPPSRVSSSIYERRRLFPFMCQYMFRERRPSHHGLTDLPPTRLHIAWSHYLESELLV